MWARVATSSSATPRTRKSTPDRRLAGGSSPGRSQCPYSRQHLSRRLYAYPGVPLQLCRTVAARSAGCRRQARSHGPKARNSWPKARNSWPKARNSWPKARDSWPKARNSWPKARNSWPKARDSWPKVSFSWPEASRRAAGFASGRHRHGLLTSLPLPHRVGPLRFTFNNRVSR